MDLTKHKDILEQMRCCYDIEDGCEKCPYVGVEACLHEQIGNAIESIEELMQENADLHAICEKQERLCEKLIDLVLRLTDDL